MGRRIALAVDLDHARQAGVTITLGDINYAEMLMLRTLAEEREAYIRELNEQSLKKRR